MDIPLPYSVRSARHHFRNVLGVIRGFSEILMEGLDPETGDLSPYEWIIESSDRIQNFVDQVLSSDEILKREDWKEPFGNHLEYDIKLIQKRVEELLILNSGEEKSQVKSDLAKIQMAADEVLKYSKDFISHGSSQALSKKER